MANLEPHEQEYADQFMRDVLSSDNNITPEQAEKMAKASILLISSEQLFFELRQEGIMVRPMMVDPNDSTAKAELEAQGLHVHEIEQDRQTGELEINPDENDTPWR